MHSSLLSPSVISLPEQITIIQSGPKAMQAPVRVWSVVRGNPTRRERLSGEGDQEIICAQPWERLSGAVKSQLGLICALASGLLQGVSVPGPLSLR